MGSGPWLSLTGGKMTGNLIVKTPEEEYNPATKLYVDNFRAKDPEKNVVRIVTTDINGPIGVGDKIKITLYGAVNKAPNYKIVGKFWNIQGIDVNEALPPVNDTVESWTDMKISQGLPPSRSIAKGGTTLTLKKDIPDGTSGVLSVIFYFY